MTKVTKRQVLEAGRLYARALEGDRASQFKLAEAISTGDFAQPIAPILQKQFVKVYHEQDLQHSKFTSRKLVSGIDRDETIEVLVVDPDQSNIPGSNMGDRFIPGTLPSIGRREAYPQIGLFPFYDKTIRASKIGEAFGIDWEAIVNSRGGQVDLIQMATDAFGRHAANSEEANVAKLLVKSTGFSDALVAQGRHIDGNPDFSDPLAFASALQSLAYNFEIDGNPVTYTDYTLLCDRSQLFAYNQMVAAKSIRRVPARAGTAAEVGGTEFEYQLDFGANITVQPWTWLRKVFPGIGKGYILVPTAGDDTYPVLTSNYLRGYETPSIWIKDGNASPAGSPNDTEIDVLTNGDFDSDAIQTKVRHVHGASMLWGNGIAYSTGANV